MDKKQIRKERIAKVKAMLKKIPHPDRLVVRSMPFGDLIDNDTGNAINIRDPEIAYGIAAAIKLAAGIRK